MEGLLYGLAEGIKSGVESYNDARKAKIAMEQKQREMDAQAAQQNRDYEFDREKFEYEKGKGFLGQDVELGKAGLRRSGSENVFEPIPGYQKPESLKDSLDIIKKRLDIKSAENAVEAGKRPPQQTFAAKQFADRMRGGEKILSSIKDFDPTSKSLIPESIAGIGQGRFKDQGRKQFDAAVDAFAMGLLRKESGAAIGKEERENVRTTFFPVSGDTPEIIAQKAELRATELANIEAEAGPALQFQTAQGLIPSGLIKEPVKSLAAPKAPTNAPKVGQVEDGHEYIGGDPSNPRSWRAVKDSGGQ